MPKQVVGHIEKILKKARGYILKGWGRNKFYDSKTKCYCAEGALNKAEGGNGNNFCSAGVSDFFVEYGVNSTSRVLYTNIPHWNDVRRRTKEQVLKAFDQAIKAAKEQGV